MSKPAKKKNVQKPALPPILGTISRRIQARYKPERIILFGSYAWGVPHKDSDFDLLIIKNKKGGFLTEQKKIHTIIDGDVAADVLILSEKELKKRLDINDFFYQAIMENGRTIYER